MIIRHIEGILQNYLFKSKALIIYGARQVGKTTLVEQLVKDYQAETLFLNGDDSDVRNMFNSLNTTSLIPIIGNYKIIVIDEAQRIPETGLALKIIHDNFKEVQLIATGSSAFELADKIKEPMTGRKFEFFLHPFSFQEMVANHGFLPEKRLIEHRLIFGYYPDIVQNPGTEVKLLKSLASSFLYKDLLALEQIKKPSLLEKILKALALQVSNEVSFIELAQLLGSDRGTIEKYIDLLEKAYIIFRLSAFSRNVRNEIKKSRKIYFFDNGIRNAVLGNFAPVSMRADAGALWENFLMSERQKYLLNNDIEYNSYFWRTTQQQEIDYLEERDSQLFAFEFKLNPNKIPSISKTFTNAYPDVEYKVISPENTEQFLLNL
jgi:hypothetical protein